MALLINHSCCIHSDKSYIMVENVFDVALPNYGQTVIFINPRRACAARVTVVVQSVCLSVRASSRTTGYEAANEWHQRVVNNEKMDINVAIFPKQLRSRDMA